MYTETIVIEPQPGKTVTIRVKQSGTVEVDVELPEPKEPLIVLAAN